MRIVHRTESPRSARQLGLRRRADQHKVVHTPDGRLSYVLYCFRLPVALGSLRSGDTIKMRILGIVALGAALGGCASNSAEIAPAYISPVAYQTYTCQQLALEAQAISTRAAALSGAQDSQHTKDG